MEESDELLTEVVSIHSWWIWSRGNGGRSLEIGAAARTWTALYPEVVQDRRNFELQQPFNQNTEAAVQCTDD